MQAIIQQLQEQVEAQLKKIEWIQEPKGLYEPIDYVLGVGGKRIRPVLALLACKAFGGDLQKALMPAIGIEVFHNFTLLHDDVMDKADTRRNQPTVHKKWNENTAILSGDAMLIKAYQLLHQAPADLLPALYQVFSQTAIEVCEGQQYDMDFETRSDVTLDEYMEMIRLKTAVLLAGSLQIGAILGGAPQADAQALYDYGIGLGLAFQLRDDYLDAFGDPRVFGKKIGGDIRNNKKCFMILTALHSAQGEDLKELQKWLAVTNPDQFGAKVEAVLALYKKLHVDTQCEEAIQFYFDKSVAAINRTQLSENQKDVFITFAHDLMGRKK